jgi:hypothetical protein
MNISDSDSLDAIIKAEFGEPEDEAHRHQLYGQILLSAFFGKDKKRPDVGDDYTAIMVSLSEEIEKALPGCVLQIVCAENVYQCGVIYSARHKIRTVIVRLYPEARKFEIEKIHGDNNREDIKSIISSESMEDPKAIDKLLASLKQWLTTGQRSQPNSEQRLNRGPWG